MKPWATIARQFIWSGPKRWIRSVPLALGLVVGGIVGSAHAAPNLVANGGFETGDFSSWLELNNFTFSGVLCPGPGLVPEGSCAAYFGPFGSDGTLQQTIVTSPGGLYNVSFAFAADGGTPSDFSVTWNGQALMSVSNPPASGFEVYNLLAVASGSATTIAFNFRDDQDYLYLDAVSVSAVPEPGASVLLALGMAAMWYGLRRRAGRTD